MLPGSDYEPLPGSPHVGLRTGPDDFPTRRTQWRAYAAACVAAVGVVAVVAVIQSSGVSSLVQYHRVAQPQ